MSQWLSGDTKSIRSQNLYKIAHVLDVNPEWLLNGRGKMRRESASVGENPASYATARRVPLIDYIQAGDPRPVVDSHAACVNDIGIDGPLAREVGPYAFALEVRGNSMAETFQDGDIVVVDPDEAPGPGQAVVAKLDRHDTATLKKYRERGVDLNNRPVVELRPLNENYASIMMNADNPGVIIGPVVELRQRRRYY